MKFPALILLIATTIASAYAQDQPVVAVATEIAKHACKAPEESPGQFASKNQHKQFKKELDIYRSCLTLYADRLRAEAGLRVKAANAAAEEFNQYVKSHGVATAPEKK